MAKTISVNIPQAPVSPRESIPVYTAVPVTGDSGSGTNVVVIDLQQHSETPGASLLEILVANGVIDEGEETAVAPGAAVDVTLKVAVADTELVAADAPAVLANAIVSTTVCRLANDTTSTLLWRSDAFAAPARYVYVWVDNDAFATHSVVALTAKLVRGVSATSLVSVDAPVTSVNGKTGDVTIDPTDLADNVTSVAGKTGAVTLELADITDAGTAAAEAATAFAEAAHTHSLTDITDAGTAAAEAATAFAAASHTHALTDITDAGTAAAEDTTAFAAASHTHGKADITDLTYLPLVLPAPASATATGTAGQVSYDATHIYLCVATDTWVRADLATWT